MKILKRLLPCVVVMTIASSCDMDININPNQVAVTSADQLLPAAILKASRMESNDFGFLGGFWSGHWGKAYDVAGSALGAANSSLEQIITYTITPDFSSNAWEDSYLNLYNLNLIAQQDGFSASPVYVGIAKVLQGYHYLRLVDNYNNVPFSEALSPKLYTPKYDNGKDVYKGAIALINEGIQNLKQGGAAPTNDDIMFKGDVNNWIRLANTLKLRSLIHLSEANESAYITEQISIIQNEGTGFLVADALVNPGFTTAESAQLNPFWSTYYRNFNGAITNLSMGVRPTRFLIEQYKTFSDPRLAQIYNAVNGEYNGVVLGQTTADATQNYGFTSSLKGPLENNNLAAGLIKSGTQSLVFFSAAESYFLQAEAAYRGWINGSAANLYGSGIKASFTYLGLSVTTADSYIAQESVAYNQSLNQIITQKWLALNGITAFEAWNDYRRLGIPAAPGSASVASGVRPYRLLYPNSELNANPVQVRLQNVTNGTDRNTRVFWQP